MAQPLPRQPCHRSPALRAAGVGGTLGRISVVALGLLASACSAPADEADGPPEFSGGPGLAPPQTSNNGNQNGGAPKPNTPATPGSSSSPPSSSAAGSSGAEPVGAGPVGLDSGQSTPSSQGAGGSSMTAPSTNDGTGGSGFDPLDPAGDEGADGPSTPGDTTQPVVSPPQPPTSPVLPPPPLPAPNAGCAGQFICDGFESAAPGASPNPAVWQVIANYSPTAQSPNVQVSAGNSRSGAQALRVVGASARNGIVADLPAQTYFMRAWIQADAVPRGPVFIGLGTTENSETRLRISERSYAVINTVGPGDAVRPNAATSANCPDCVTLVANRWFCAEFFIDNAARNATLWIDGVEAANIANGEGGWPTQPATPQLFLGSMGLQGGATGVWIDDVAAGPQRIGCD